jgi:hypothetical protein
MALRLSLYVSTSMTLVGALFRGSNGNSPIRSKDFSSTSHQCICDAVFSRLKSKVNSLVGNLELDFSVRGIVYPLQKMLSRSNFHLVEHLPSSIYDGLQLNHSGRLSKGRVIGKST